MIPVLPQTSHELNLFSFWEFFLFSFKLMMFKCPRNVCVDLTFFSKTFSIIANFWENLAPSDLEMFSRCFLMNNSFKCKTQPTVVNLNLMMGIWNTFTDWSLIGCLMRWSFSENTTQDFSKRLFFSSSFSSLNIFVIQQNTASFWVDVLVISSQNNLAKESNWWKEYLTSVTELIKTSSREVVKFRTLLSKAAQ